MVEHAVIEKLLARAGVTALAARRIFPCRVPQGELYPNIVVQRISGPRVSSMSGPSGLAHPTVQVDCRAEDYGDAKLLADECRKELDGFRGDAFGFKIQGLHLDDEHDEDEPALDDDDKATYRVKMTFRVWFEEDLK